MPPLPLAARHTRLGRLFIIIVAAGGTLQLLANNTILNATTVSGTMVVGLGPPVFALMFVRGYRPLAFHMPFWAGMALAIVYQVRCVHT